MGVLPMFPLGSVLFPGALLPLHVFEDRYRALMRACLEDDRRFGVVLIERGHEVGGGDARFDVGTVARILEAEELPDGRWVLVAVGTSRIRVDEWLPDDPYPRARVDVLTDPLPGPEVPELIDRSMGLLRAVLALRSEAGQATPDLPTELPEDPTDLSLLLSAVAAPGPLDAQRLLEAPGVALRLTFLVELLQEERSTLEALLAQG